MVLTINEELYKGVNMSVLSWMNNRMSKIDVLDVALIKWSVFAIALYIAKIWEPILSLDSSVYLVLGVLFVIRPFYNFYVKK
jgi:hypothetical protein